MSTSGDLTKEKAVKALGKKAKTYVVKTFKKKGEKKDGKRKREAKDEATGEAPLTKGRRKMKMTTKVTAGTRVKEPKREIQDTPDI